MRFLTVWVALALTTSLVLTQNNVVIVRGSVVRSDNGAPIAQASVTLISEDPERIVQSISSDANGRFEFRNVAPGRYRVQAQRTGGLVFLVQESTSGIVLQRIVAGSTPVSEVTLAMAPQGAISGRVTDANGSPAPGATVTAVVAGFRAGVRTLGTVATVRADATGSYRLFGLNAGELYIHAEARPGRTTADTGTYYPSSSDVETAVPIVFKAGDDLSSVDIQLRSLPTVPVRIRVVDDTGNPRQASLTLEPTDRLTPIAGGPTVVLSVTSTSPTAAPTNEQTRNLRPGSYELIARTASQPPEQGRVSLKASIGSAETVTVVVKPGVDVGARVVSSGGARVNPSNLRYVLEQRDRVGFAMLAPSDSDFTGTFKFRAVPEGKAVPRIQGLPPDHYVADVRQDGRSVFSDGLITIAGQPVSIEWEVRADGGRVEGTVQGARSPGIADTRVVLVPDAPRRANSLLYRATHPDATGRFALEGVAPGNYQVFAWESIPNEAWENAEYLAAYTRFGRPVVVGSGIPATVTVDWIPATVTPPALSTRVTPPPPIVDSTTPFIEGIVTNALSGKPVAGARVRLSLRPQDARETTTDLEGKFSLPQVPEGSFTITVMHDGFMGPLVNGNYSDAVNQTITIDKRTPKVSLTISMNPAGSISGRVLDLNGKPAVREQVQFANLLMPTRNATTITNDRGEFRASRIIPGQYAVGVRAPLVVTSAQQKEGVGPARTFFPGTIDFAKAAPVVVGLGAEVGNIDFQIQSTRIFRISGKIRVDLTGLQFPPNVLLRPNVRAISAAEPTIFTPVLPSAVDPASGEFEIRGVPAGKYAIVATLQAPGALAAAVAMVDVGNQDVLDIPLLLRKGMDLGVEIVNGTQQASISRQLTLVPRLNETTFNSRIAGPANASNYVLPNVFPGTYNLSINMLGNECIRDMIQSGRSILESGVTILEGSADPIRIVLETPRQTLTRPTGTLSPPRCP